ncbi:MAG: long-chain fatty acid--CoA ligase [Thermoanaerobaculales bacterium]|nr:long-chain fatty acid--CoA ligase [Thermoanaerobaculales bacterium]
MEIVDFRNIHHLLKETVDRCGDQSAYKWILDSGETDSVTWNGFYVEARAAAKSLIALGVEKGDKVNILSYTRYRWVLTDVACASIGSCAVGIYQSLLANDVEYIVNHSDSVLVFAEDEGQVEKLFEIRDTIPNIRKVILFSGTVPEDEWVMSYEDFLALGAEVADEVLQDRIDNVTPEDVATIVYTSGTTGIPKGAVLTHDNVTFTAQSVYGSTQILEGDETLLFLPLAHIFARTLVFSALVSGVSTTFSRGIDSIGADFLIARPHWFPSVPRIFEKVHTKIISGAEAKGGLALKIFRWACRVGDRVSDIKLAGKEIPPLTKIQYAIATKLVFSKVQAALGGRVRWCISGAAPINPSIAKFFHAAGILIVEGIGMTENMSFTNLNRYDNYRFGWVGLPGPGIEQKIGDDGEVLYRGRNIMREYYKMPAETAETLTADGWQHTGDLGEIDEENFLRITGRKKDLIITAGGKNVAPSAVEGVVATSKYISQVCTIGDRRAHLTALITVDADNIRQFAKEQGVSGEETKDLIKDERVVELIQSEVTAKNKDLASFETIKKFRLLEEFTIENGLLTPTMKIKRHVALERFSDLVEEMYSEG